MQEVEEFQSPPLECHRSMHERGSVIMKRARIYLLGDLKTEKKGIFSCFMGGGKAEKYVIDKPEDRDELSTEEDEDEGW